MGRVRKPMAASSSTPNGWSKVARRTKVKKRISLKKEKKNEGLERGSRGIPDAEAFFGNAGLPFYISTDPLQTFFFFFPLRAQSPFRELLSFYEEDGTPST